MSSLVHLISGSQSITSPHNTVCNNASFTLTHTQIVHEALAFYMKKQTALFVPAESELN